MSKMPLNLTELDLLELGMLETDEAMSIESLLPPDGRHIAVIGMIDTTKGTTWGPNKQGGEWIAYTIPMTITFPNEQGDGEMVDYVLRHKLFVDLDRMNGKMYYPTAVGQNKPLAALRIAAGCNVPGKKFSIRHLEGQMVAVTTRQHQFESKEGQTMTGVRATSFSEP